MFKISVIVPIYNVSKYLDRCINSLIYQTLQDIQIILVNDGSTDDSGIIAKEFAHKYPNKITYLEKENGGLSDARNFGIQYAKGEYIAFLDSDDYIEKDAYENMYNKLAKENSDYIECDFIWEYTNKSKIDKIYPYENSKEMLAFVRVVAWNKLIKTEIIKKNNIEFPKGLRYEDVEFTYKLIPYLNKVSYIDKPYIHYTQRKDSIVNMQNKHNEDIFIVLDNVIDFYKKMNLYDKYKEQLEYNYARYLLCSSFKRICKIKDKEEKNRLLDETWVKLNSKFPNWKKNRILCTINISKNIYMRTVNKTTFKMYSKL